MAIKYQLKWYQHFRYQIIIFRRRLVVALGLIQFL